MNSSEKACTLQLLHSVVSQRFSCAHVSLGDPAGDKICLSFVISPFDNGQETMRIEMVGISNISGGVQAIDFACTAYYKDKQFLAPMNSISRSLDWIEDTCAYIKKWCRF